ncbi:E3 SUMO-protein ligase ZBED1-like [Antennarius striatus]|uniref:E3 SUMO-protein ligase ZBED1-like n=1 Tax=Antennarius striatus TaxID=241820 RepID=UPI0035B19653
MSSTDNLGGVVKKQRTIENENTFEDIKGTVNYEEEADCKRGLLDAAWKPVIQSHQTDGPEHHVCKEEEEEVEVPADQQLWNQEMDPGRKRKFSPVWEYFELTALNKVRCLLCDKELTYSNNTSSMLRHYRALHENAQPPNGPDTSQSNDSRKAMVDQSLVNMIIKDSQPFSIVEDVGFRQLIRVLDPNYLLPSKKALKAMVNKKYQDAKEKAKEQVQKAAAVSITSDMWASINMDAYLAVTCHFIDEEDQLSTALLGVQHFPKAHTPENLAAGHVQLMEEWGIRDKVKCLITDGASNMNACARQLNVRHAVCIAHTINLIVRKSFDDVEGLNELRQKSRRLVTLFKTSTTATERLVQVQEQMGRQPCKMVIEVDTRWNSTFHMLQRLYELREPVGAALASLKTDILPLTASEYDTVKDVLYVLAPLQQATVEVSAEKRVSASKVIPMMKMLHHTITSRVQAMMTSTLSRELRDNLLRRLREHTYCLESAGALTMPTLLDPRFKKLGFQSAAKTQEAVNRLKDECVMLVRNEDSSATPDQLRDTPMDQSADNNELWQLLDESINSSRSSSSVVDATVEVDRYLAEVNIARAEDPLMYWKGHKRQYPHLYTLSRTWLCSPASSVPCEQVFSKAGEILSKRRNRLNPRTLEKLLFLNENEQKYKFL